MRLVCSIFHSFTHFLAKSRITRSLHDSLTHSLNSFICSVHHIFVHSFMHRFRLSVCHVMSRHITSRHVLSRHPFMHPFIYSFCPSLLRCFILESYFAASSLVRSFAPSLVHSRTRSLIHPSIHPSIHQSMNSFNLDSFMQESVHSSEH